MFCAQHLDIALRWPLQSDDRPQENRFPGAGAADYAQDLSAQHVKVNVVMKNVGRRCGSPARVCG